VTPRSTLALWGIVAAICAVDAIWLLTAGITIKPSSVVHPIAATVALISEAAFYKRSRRDDRIVRVADSTAQIVALSAPGIVLSYFFATIGGPTWDDAFARLDLALGFDWQAFAIWIASVPHLHFVLSIAYAALLPQTVLSVIYLATRRSAEELIWAIVVSTFVTVALSPVFPCAGHFPDASYAQTFLALRLGTVRVIDLAAPEGIIAFPSYHTAMAILLAFVMRREWPSIFAGACALDGLMVIACPTEGGHYLVDVIGGGAVAVVTIAILTLRPARTLANEAAQRA